MIYSHQKAGLLLDIQTMASLVVHCLRARRRLLTYGTLCQPQTGAAYDGTTNHQIGPMETSDLRGAQIVSRFFAPKCARVGGWGGGRL